MRTHAGIIDQDVDGHSLRLDLFHQAGGRAGLAEIRRDDDRARAMSFQLLGECFHRLDATSRHDQVVPIPGQLAREIGTDAARCAGHQRDRASPIVGVRPV